MDTYKLHLIYPDFKFVRKTHTNSLQAHYTNFMTAVLVTGAAGFIGSHLSEFLVSKGETVVGLDNLSTGNVRNLSSLLKSNNFSFVEGDICKIDELLSKRGKQFECVYHLAALADIVPSIEHPDEYYQTNVNGTFKVIEFVKSFGIEKIVYAASSSCYGIAQEIPTSEFAPIDPKYPYALTKFLGEQIVLHWAKMYGFHATSLRLFNVYGRRARTSGNYGAVLGVFLAQKLAGQPLTIVGDGNQTRDFTHVSDVVDAFYRASRKPSQSSTRILNVGSGRTVSVNELARLIGGEKKNIPKRPGEPNVTFANIEAIKAELDWLPKKDFESGIQELLTFIQDFKDAPVWSPETIENATRVWFERLGNA